MLVLAIDTSGKQGSMALACCSSEGSCEVIEVAPLAGGTFSAQLIPQLAALLEKHRLSKHDIGAFAAACGPGSFTGLRVGLAAIKALAEILAKPVAAVSVLEALALEAKSLGKISAVLDAGRDQLYVGEYQVGDTAQFLSERLLTREEFLQSPPGALIVTPNEKVSDLARSAGLRVIESEYPRSDVIARIGWQKILGGQTVSPEELDANYIRRSDAEILSKVRPSEQ